MSHSSSKDHACSCSSVCALKDDIRKCVCSKKPGVVIGIATEDGHIPRKELSTSLHVLAKLSREGGIGLLYRGLWASVCAKALSEALQNLLREKLGVFFRFIVTFLGAYDTSKRAKKM